MTVIIQHIWELRSAVFDLAEVKISCFLKFTFIHILCLTVHCMSRLKCRFLTCFYIQLFPHGRVGNQFKNQRTSWRCTQIFSETFFALLLNSRYWYSVSLTWLSFRMMWNRSSIKSPTLQMSFSFFFECFILSPSSPPRLSSIFTLAFFSTLFRQPTSASSQFSSSVAF